MPCQRNPGPFPPKLFSTDYVRITTLMQYTAKKKYQEI